MLDPHPAGRLKFSIMSCVDRSDMCFGAARNTYTSRALPREAGRLDQGVLCTCMLRA